MNKSRTDIRQLFPCTPPDLEPIIETMLHLRTEVLRREAAYKNLDKLHPQHRNSARNLLHYLAFRLHDLRNLQLDLTEWGVSSLGRAERKVQATIDTVLTVLHHLSGKPWQPKEAPPICFREARRRLEENSEALLGAAPSGRRVRIMVTMPAEAADNYGQVLALMQNGMNCARINCAHDSPLVWSRIIDNIRRAENAAGRKCHVLMDLGGPKLRTSALEPGATVAKVRPLRNEFGEVKSPSHIWLFPENSGVEVPADADLCLPVPADWLSQCKEGDRITLTDARGAARRLRVVAASPEGCWAGAKKTIYFTPGIELKLEPKNGKVKNKTVRLVGEMPRRENAILLQNGDLLLLLRRDTPGRPAVLDSEGKVVSPAFIGCSLPQILNDVQVGESISFDDGKIGGVIERIEAGQVHVRINQVKLGGDKLRSEKGINLPESNLRLPALTEDDLRDLKFVVEHADMVGLSFANRPDDVEDLIKHIRRLKKGMPGIVLKIETPRGFDNLPAMLLSAMQMPVCGVMIARGDLAIECGFGRLAEVQEQILWICEAAHVPVIWATQVLEGLAKAGMPTRSEITDAAMGQRAECIMLNKGDHIVEATKALDDILRRMQDHQTKKRSMLRKLHLAEKFFGKI